MSGGNYGSVILYLIAAALALAAAILAIFSFFGFALWQAFLLTYAVAFFSSTAFVLWANRNNMKNISNIIPYLSTIAQFASFPVIAVCCVYWLFRDATLWAVLSFFAASYFYWQLQNFLKWRMLHLIIFLILSTLILFNFENYFSYYSIIIFTFLLFFNIVVRRSVWLYLKLVAYPDTYYWYRKNIDAQQWSLLFDKTGKIGQDDFLAHYTNEFICDYSAERLEKLDIKRQQILEPVFWQIVNQKDINWLSQKDGQSYDVLFIACNFEFIKKWQIESQKNENMARELESFAQNCQIAVAQFIETPSSYQQPLFTKTNLEQELDVLLTEITNQNEELKIAFGLFYVAIGVARNFDENTQ